ncbi:hypothetical protein ACFSHQ_00440 [Gemmobacter lanyuensis]
MRRVTVAEIMRETGLSRATVDRVLNGRGHVHPRTRAAVEDTLARLGRGEAPPPVIAADIALRVGRGMMAQMRDAWQGAGLTGRFEDLYLADEDQVLRRIEDLCRDANRPLILTAKNSDRLTDLLREARGGASASSLRFRIWRPRRGMPLSVSTTARRGRQRPF